MYTVDDEDEDVNQKENISIEQRKCKKCRVKYHNRMLQCENSNCRKWLCSERCSPKIYKSGDDFFVLKNVKMLKLTIIIKFNVNLI